MYTKIHELNKYIKMGAYSSILIHFDFLEDLTSLLSLVENLFAIRWK